MLLTTPILLPLATAALLMLFMRRHGLQAVMNLLGSLASLAAATALFAGVWNHGVLATHLGAWPAPFGITLVADLLSASMVLLAALMGVAVAVFALADVDSRRAAFGFYPLFQVLLLGVTGAFLTGDLFNLYVWFEVMLIASFVLIALGGERSQLEGAVKYVTLNILSSILLLSAVGILYGATGTLNMADLSARSAELEASGLAPVLAVIFLVAFGIKAAAFPLFFWLPASYHTPPATVSAIFAGLLTKVGVYALLRVFTLVFNQDVGLTHTLITVVAGLTMITGVLGAVAETEFRRILSFHIVSQIGYMLMGLGLLTPLALAGSIFYIVHHIVVKTNLFLVAGAVQALRGTGRLERLGGVMKERPALAVLFLLSALSLAGIPPLSGFWAKFVLVRAGIEAEQYVIVASALLVSLLTLFSMTKIWAAVFWRDDPEPDAARPLPGGKWAALVAPVVLLAVVSFGIGLSAGPVFGLASRAAEQLLNPAEYVEAVLGTKGG